MSRTISHLDLSGILDHRPERPFRDLSSSNRFPLVSPSSLESPFDPEPAHASSRYREALGKMTQGKDYNLLYRLSADGNLTKVVRRHEFNAINLGEMSRYRQQTLAVQSKAHSRDVSADMSPEQKPPPTHQKSQSCSEPAIIQRVASSQSLLAARRILSTTLSLEYGPKTIKTNSSVAEFLEYYKHRSVRSGAKRLQLMQFSSEKHKLSRKKQAEAVKLKYVKTNYRIEKLLGEIQAENWTRKVRRKAVRSCQKSPVGLGKPSLHSSTRPVSPSRALPLSEIEARVSAAQESLQPLRQSRENLRARLAQEMLSLSSQLTTSNMDES